MVEATQSGTIDEANGRLSWTIRVTARELGEVFYLRYESGVIRYQIRRRDDCDAFV